MTKIKEAAKLGPLALIVAIGFSGCAWGPLKTGAPRIDKALAAIHDAGYPARGREPWQYGKDVDGLRASTRNNARY